MEDEKIESIITELLEKDYGSLGCFIDGKVNNFLHHVPAIASSKRALDGWQKHRGRSTVLRTISERLKFHEKLFLKVASMESRTLPKYIKADIDYAIDGFHYFSKVATKLSVTRNDLIARGCLGGVILRECPPFTALTWLTAAPLITGNTVVLLVKSSFSLIALCFAVLSYYSGLPAGVLNVIPFVDVTPFPDISFPEIAVNFTSLLGIVPEMSSSNNFHFSTVLKKNNAQNPMLVSIFADIDSMISCFIDATRNHEVTWYPNVIYVQEPVYEKFLKALRHNVRVNNSMSEDTGYEPSTILKDFVNEKRGQGFEVIELCHRYMKCLLILNHDHSQLSSLEIVDEWKVVHHLVSVLPVRTLDEGFLLANNKAGLCASFWSNDAVETISAPFQLEYGTVWVNSAGLYSPSVPVCSWMPDSYGTFAGKRMVFEHSVLTKIQTVEILQNTGPGDIDFPWEPTKEVIEAALTSFQKMQVPRSKLDLKFRLHDLEKTAAGIQNYIFENKRNNLSSFHPFVKQAYKNCAEYFDFWSNYAVDSMYEQIIPVANCRVLCQTEPLGTIGIVSGSAMFDTIMFMVAAALAYGNTVIVGICRDRVLYDLEEVTHLRDLLPDRVRIVVGMSTTVWELFINNQNIDSVWFEEGTEMTPTKPSFRRIFEVNPDPNMLRWAESFETHATKQKCVWLPHL